VTARPKLTATYRVQISRDFDLAAARAQVDYLHRLGVSHLYTSPILTARPGSTHGYDVVDPRGVNPELGGDEARLALVAELRAHGMGMLLDIVPNHMGIGPDNPFWMDVLARGQASPYAAWFDIDWEAPALRGRILLPVLGDPLDVAIARDQLTVNADHGSAYIKYFDHRFPLAAGTAPASGDVGRYGGDEPARTRLRALLEQQHYVLADWRRAAAEINYRRFFDISDLAAVRVEDPTVFADTHALLLSWIADGSLDGLRVDHVDGLLDPLAYLQALRAAVASRQPGESVPIFVEKILSDGERPRSSWPVDGTTGYEFLNELESMLVAADGVRAIEQYYRKSVLRSPNASFGKVAGEGKVAALSGGLATDVARLVRLALPTIRRLPRKAVSRAAVTRAVREIIAALPVYRTYIDRRGCISDEDRSLIERAAADASRLHHESAEAITVVRRLLIDSGRKNVPADSLPFALRFQQVSGPAAAKGVEDTALYRYVPLVSLNEVGGAPDRSLEDAVGALHRASVERAASWPRQLLTATTHDTKRSADVRARLDVLSEIPDVWTASVRRWRRANRAHAAVSPRRRSPDANTEYLLYQTMVGIWQPGDADRDRRGIARRIEEYMRKAAREARVRTSWLNPDDAFEKALSSFVETLLIGPPGASFRDDLDCFVRRIAPAGAWNSLARTLVHLTAPGTPDIYQGDELWNFALVDPDNRRPVDYDRRAALLDELDSREREVGLRALSAELTGLPADDRLKLHVVRTALRARRAHPALFGAAYLPLTTAGARASHVFAFARERMDRTAIVVVPRLSYTLSHGAAPIGEHVWRDTTVMAPHGTQSLPLRNVFTGETMVPSHSLRVADVLDAFPVALLVSDD
jgi:(1->4)-alpha-D-glucan 1-alpha-D-glucosylmutase